MRKLRLPQSLILPALMEGPAVGAKSEPAFAGVQGAFFAFGNGRRGERQMDAEKLELAP